MRHAKQQQPVQVLLDREEALMCGHDEDGAGTAPVRTITLEPGETLVVFGRIPGQRPTSLFDIFWDVNEGHAVARAYETTGFDGDGQSLINEWEIEV